VFGGHRIRFGLMDGAVRMVGRRVQCVQFQGFGRGCIDHIVECAGRHHNGIAGMYEVFLFAAEYEFGVPFFDAKELVNGVVNFIADFLARL
jgi:hypothetical protein